jgi:hypothetical protein
MGGKQALLSVVCLLGLVGLCRAEGEGLLQRETLADGKRSIGRFWDKNYCDDVDVYTSCDQVFHKKNADPEDDQGLGGFFKYGYAPSKKNDIANSYSLVFNIRVCFMDGMMIFWTRLLLTVPSAIRQPQVARKIQRTTWKTITTLESHFGSI